ncbi:MAG: Wzt carbohydrate-binding domain-containing protein, partial [Flavobacteriales bacterium]|nr:Wzt carbohydrate-binding domain-containing protein [Flavobacteriales bacterium]
INISTQDGTDLYHFSNRFIEKTLITEDGNLILELSFLHQLKPGNYTISFYIGQNETQLDWVENAASMIVPPYNPHGFHNPSAIQGPIISDFDITEN